MYDYARAAQHLAWHETLELHELTAYQSNILMALKMHLPSVQDPALRGLYSEAIQGTERNLRELVPYYQMAPRPEMRFAAVKPAADLTGFYAGHLLGYAKTAVKNYANAITETATPALRDTFQAHLQRAIGLHAKAFGFMLERGFYPAYDLNQLLAGDLKNAQAALGM
ncbi:spore coat protein [Cohnella caldifontis]|uniref:spore coat protein n=1 Tax=Cohnella caldifontis TaxID=3027471 RepID=UPI0023EAAE8B|nr:spore coat protein [Cohnella sp. YIM B05605]